MPTSPRSAKRCHSEPVRAAKQVPLGCTPAWESTPPLRTSPAASLPTTKARPGGARSRLSKKPVIASQCAHWRGNPFLKRVNSAFFADFCLKKYGFPRRFAPRNDRGEVYRHAEARPGGARSCLFRYRSFMPEYFLLQRENAG